MDIERFVFAETERDGTEKGAQMMWTAFFFFGMLFLARQCAANEVPRRECSQRFLVEQYSPFGARIRIIVVSTDNYPSMRHISGKRFGPRACPASAASRAAERRTIIRRKI